jgi:hypothetical protein
MKIFKFLSRILLLLVFAFSLIFIFFKPDDLVDMRGAIQSEIGSLFPESEANLPSNIIKKVPEPRGVNEDLEKSLEIAFNLVLIFLLFYKRPFFVTLINLFRKIIDMSAPEKRKLFTYVLIFPLVGYFAISVFYFLSHLSDYDSYVEWEKVSKLQRKMGRYVYLSLWSDGKIYLLCEFSKICSLYFILRLISDVNKENQDAERRKIV